MNSDSPNTADIERLKRDDFLAHLDPDDLRWLAKVKRIEAAALKDHRKAQAHE